MTRSRGLPQRAGLPARLVAGAVLAALAAAWLHTAGAPHVTCPEHGEGVHLALHGGAPAPGAGQPAAAAATTAPDAHAHDHCGFQHQGRTPLPAPDCAVARVLDQPPTARAQSNPPASSRIISFAPKTSPPRAAA